VRKWRASPTERKWVAAIDDVISVDLATVPDGSIDRGRHRRSSSHRSSTASRRAVSGLAEARDRWCDIGLRSYEFTEGLVV
jgi:hypothetical protein